ncbi:MAG TPA: recombinase RecA [Acidobacteriaceae bacterium]|nr:recombinase RecA [Acidobacteriaceae bacterium]
MPTSATIRIQIESALEKKYPSALTPQTRTVRHVVSSGIGALDDLLHGGLPLGALTEMFGESCSGRMSVALSFLAQITSAGNVCAWIDASDTFHPASAAGAGVDLKRLLWVRCGVRESLTEQETRQFALPAACLIRKTPPKGLHGGGHGTHPRSEARGLSSAVDRFLNNEAVSTCCAEPISKPQPASQEFTSNLQPASTSVRTPCRARVYDAVEQALRSTDLLIQTGGFSAIVLDLGEIAKEVVSRIELSTWHRYRVASEQMQASILLLSQYACAKSSSELQLRLAPLEDTREERTVFTGLSARAEVLRQRFAQTHSNLVPMRKPPQRAAGEARWTHRARWAGPR